MRNLALILVPAAALGGAAIVLAAWFGPSAGAGALALAAVPAPLAGSDAVTRLGRRGDLAGALVIGTVAVSLLAFGVWAPDRRGPEAGGLSFGQVLSAVQPYVVAAIVANALPTLRDAVLLPLRWIGVGAMVVTLAVMTYASVATAIDPLAGPPIDASVVGSAVVLFIVGVATAWVVARLTSRDTVAAVAGGGLRDPTLAVVAAVLVGGPDAAAVPLVYAGMCVAALAAFAYRGRYAPGR